MQNTILITDEKQHTVSYTYFTELSGLFLPKTGDMSRLKQVQKEKNTARMLLKVKGCVQLFMRNPPQSYRASPAIWDHT